MIRINFLKVPILLVLLSIFSPSAIFSMEEDAEEHKFSASLFNVAQKVQDLEDVVVSLKKTNGMLLKEIQERTNFFDSIFSLAANKNHKDFELIQAEYSFKKEEITALQLAAVQQRVSAAVIIDGLPSGLVPSLPGGISPGVRAVEVNTAVTALAAESLAVLAPDPGRSTPFRGISSATTAVSTIRGTPQGMAALDVGLARMCLEDDNGKIIKKLFEAAEAKDDE